MSDDIRIRRIANGDWDGIVAMEAAAYAELGLSEGRAALQSRAASSPSTCFALDVGSRLAGYLLALPCPEFRSPALRGLETTAVSSSNLHLHDIVITQVLRRRGLGGGLLRHLMLTARSRAYERISLVAVGGSQEFWSAHGFTAHPDVPPPQGYGDDALYMSKALGSCRGRPPWHRDPAGSALQNEVS
ncbi:GNAT family N-acetyltransferase [Streptomyces sp. MB09-02B]|uniref:GNAT family N-acetyltransferase n=1 Tax=Streptomyces sp. MB09-02B TaxID=3028667 RepID=UPI0029A42B83|nr:GNAT family N-acetyltransferase [Streptomyces sp. MB09-02B]MDX3638437.1 GNAT family N-acetyltransferase [Streptomyces sp. MB09-02B]